MPPSAVRNRPLGTGDNSRTPDPRPATSSVDLREFPDRRANFCHRARSVRSRPRPGRSRPPGRRDPGSPPCRRHALSVDRRRRGVGQRIRVHIRGARGRRYPRLRRWPWGILPSAGTLRTPSSGETAACRGVWEEFTVEFTDGRLLTPPARRCAERISTRHATGRAKSALSPSGPIPSGPIPISVPRWRRSGRCCGRRSLRRLAEQRSPPIAGFWRLGLRSFIASAGILDRPVLVDHAP